MSGEVIQFRKRNSKGAGLYRTAGVPRGPTLPTECEQQMGRIAQLIDELEELTGGPEHLCRLLTQARISIVAGDTATPSQPDIDPQPNVDRDTLERMYRDLGVYP